MSKPRLTCLKPRVQSLPDRVRALPRPSRATGKSLYDYRWQKRRERHLRLNPLCVYCLRNGFVTPATVADHITPHRGDPALFEGPLQSLCATCHSSVKAKEEARG